MKKLIKIYFSQTKKNLKYSWNRFEAYLAYSHEFIIQNSFRKIYFLLIIYLFTGCDKVVQDVTPTPSPVIPQASTEVFKQMYPEVATFIFKPLEMGKTWQTDFVSPRGKTLSLVDYQGEIIDLNELVGATKSLPISIKQYISNNYPKAQIIMAYDVMKSSTQTDGYKLKVQIEKNNTIDLFFDSNNAFLRSEKTIAEKVSAINFTSSEQLNFDSKIPQIVKKFISENQLKDASITIYELTNGGNNSDSNYKIILNFRERQNGSLLTSEITLSNTGNVLQWISSIESESSYKPLNTNELPSDVTTFLNTNFSGWTLDYAASESIFGKNNTNFINVKNAPTERFLVVDDENEKNDLILIRSQVLEEKDLPMVIKNAMSNAYPGSLFVSGVATFEPYYQATRLGGANPVHYQIETKEGPNQYVLRIANDGKLIFRYRVQ